MADDDGLWKAVHRPSTGILAIDVQRGPELAPDDPWRQAPEHEAERRLACLTGAQEAGDAALAQVEADSVKAVGGGARVAEAGAFQAQHGGDRPTTRWLTTASASPCPGAR